MGRTCQLDGRGADPPSVCRHSPPAEFQGRSLLEMLRPGSPKTTRDVYSESLYAHNHFGCASLRSLRTGHYKYIQAPKPELYDLAADPGETRNLYEQKRSLALAAREKLDSSSRPVSK